MQFHLFFTDLDCSFENGIGGFEIELGGLYTYHECVNKVKKQHPNASEATMDRSCQDKCKCFAKYDTFDKDSVTNWQCCKCAGN